MVKTLNLFHENATYMRKKISAVTDPGASWLDDTGSSAGTNHTQNDTRNTPAQEPPPKNTTTRL
jgi:hypothetical protein